MDSQPETLETLKAELAVARAKAADDAAMITQQKLEIAKLTLARRSTFSMRVQIQLRFRTLDVSSKL